MEPTASPLWVFLVMAIVSIVILGAYISYLKEANVRTVIKEPDDIPLVPQNAYIEQSQEIEELTEDLSGEKYEEEVDGDVAVKTKKLKAITIISTSKLLNEVKKNYRKLLN